MKVVICHAGDCPNAERTRTLVQDVAAELGLSPSIEVREIKNQFEAELSESFGSPTIQIDGEDIDPTASQMAVPNTGCRIYGTRGVPPRELIVRALEGRAKP